MSNTDNSKPIRWKGWHLRNGEPQWHAFPATFFVAMERDTFVEIITNHRKIGAARASQKKVFGSIIIRVRFRPEHNGGGILHVPWSMEQGRVDEVYEEDLTWLDSL